MNHSYKSSLSVSNTSSTSMGTSVSNTTSHSIGNSPTPYQVQAYECTNCGKYKVILNHTQYLLNGREAKEGQPHLWVEETPQGNLFSLHPTPHAKRWKIIQSQSIIAIR